MMGADAHAQKIRAISVVLRMRHKLYEVILKTNNRDNVILKFC